jgi:hypothetical protein
MPVADFSYRSKTPFRSELKMMRDPSGDHTASSSAAGSDVTRLRTFRPTSKTQTSTFPPVFSPGYQIAR